MACKISESVKMEVAQTIAQVRELVKAARESERTIGLVPPIADRYILGRAGGKRKTSKSLNGK